MPRSYLFAHLRIWSIFRWTLACAVLAWCISVNFRVSKPIPRKWPPSHLSEIFSTETGVLDLSLRPTVKLTKNGTSESDLYLSSLRKLYVGNVTNGGSLKDFALLDRAVRLGGGEMNFDIYPQIMDVRSTVAAVKSGQPLDQAPINDPKILAITSPDVTSKEKLGQKISQKSSSKLDLMVLIKSCATCFEDRKRARSTFMRPEMWGNFRIQFVFVTGLPYISSSPITTVGGVDINYNHARITKRTKLKEALRMLFREVQLHGDLLIGGFRDSYCNLTLKLTLTFRWASIFYADRAPIFLFMDDDFAVIPVNIARFVRTLTLDEQSQLIGGLPTLAPYPYRPLADPRGNKWAVSRDDYPWNIYPNFLHGGAYMVGSKRVCDASIAMAFTRPIRLDDVFLGLVWRKLHYFPLVIPGFLKHIENAEIAVKTKVAFYSALNSYIDWNASKYWVREE